MDQKGIIKLEIEKGENVYSFEMPIGFPYGEAYDAGVEYLQKIAKMAQERVDIIRKQKEESDKIMQDSQDTEKKAKKVCSSDTL